MSIADNFLGTHRAFLDDTTPEICLEGALGSGKTIVALWKLLDLLERYPRMWALTTRWVTDQVDKLLRPEFERVARLHKTPITWNNREGYYGLENESRCFSFGLQTVEIDPLRRYGKLRGFNGSIIYIDQPESVPLDFLPEVRRRLRDNIDARDRGESYPTQLLLTPNPVPHWHWLSQQFPEDNSIPSRKYYAVSLFDNAHNLPDSVVKAALLETPPTHPRYRELIMGRRPEIIDYSKLEKKPFTEDMAGYLFEQAKNEAWKYASR